MFEHIVHNTECKLVKKYNKLIDQRPKSKGKTLAETLEAQKKWSYECNDLLLSIRTKYELEA